MLSRSPTRAAIARRRGAPTAAPATAHPAHAQALALQRAVGNAAAGRALAGAGPRRLARAPTPDQVMDLGRRLRVVIVGLSDALAGRGGDVGDQATALADLNRDALAVRLATSNPAAARTISRLRTLVLDDPPNLAALQGGGRLGRPRPHRLHPFGLLDLRPPAGTGGERIGDGARSGRARDPRHVGRGA